MSRLQIDVLSGEEVERLHERSLDVLEAVGFKTSHPETLEILQRVGAHVDKTTGIVRLPRQLVGQLLAQAPSRAPATGLNGRQLEIGGGNRYYLSLIVDPFVIDFRGGPRAPVLEDVRRHTIVGESLDRVSAMMRMQYPVSDVAGPDSYYKTMEVFLLHMTKHVAVYPTSEENCREWMDVMAVIADAADVDVLATPLASVAMAVTSPLQVHPLNIEIMKMAMERSYPIISTVCPMAGATAPYSMAGTMLIANVEALIPVLVAQVYKPGHPVLYAAGPSVMDMRTGSDLYYKAEKMLFKVAGTQMGRFYGLPIAGEAGGTLTHRPDVQNGAESMAYLLASLTGGQNLIGGLGSLYNANGMSAEQIVMQCGLADMAEYLASGIDMDEGKLAFESIQTVGPGGHYLDDELTLRLLRKDEFFETRYLDLTGGQRPGSPGAYEIAHQTVDDLVNAYAPTVPERVQDAIRAFFRDKYQDKRLAAR